MVDYVQKTLGKWTYWERLHGDVQAESPIVVTMHWLTGTAQAMAFLLADIEKPVREIAIQGSYPSGLEAGGFSWFPEGLDFYEKLSESEQDSLIRVETEKISELLAALKKEYTGKIIVTGFSQGGDLSLYLAVYHPDLVDLALPCAGVFPEAVRPETNTGTTRLRLHLGGADKTVSVDDTQNILEWLKKSGFDAELSIYEGIAHEYSLEMIANIQHEIISL